MANLLRIATARHSAGLEDAEVEAGMSPTEQAITAAEATTEMMEIESDLTNATRLEDQAAGMEDAAEAIDNITSATEGEVHLADIAADLGTAGTDAEVEIFNDVPEGGEAVGVESFTGRSIGTEGLKEMAKNFWEEVKRLVAKAWEQIIKFWRKITDQVPGIVKQARELEKRAEDAAGKVVKEKKTSLASEGRALVLGDAAPKSIKDVKDAVSAMKDVASVVLSTDAERVHKAGEALGTALNSFDLDKSEASLGTVNTAVQGIIGSSACGVAIGSDPRYSGLTSVTVKRSAYLPNGLIIVQGVTSPSTKSGSLGYASSLRAQFCQVVHHNDKDPKDHGSIQIDTPTLAEIRSLAGSIEDLASIVKDFQAKHLRKLEQAANKIKGAGSKIAGQVKDDTPLTDTKNYQAAVRFATSYAGWCATPFNRVASLTLTTCRAAIEAGNKSLRNYGNA